MHVCIWSNIILNSCHGMHSCVVKFMYLCMFAHIYIYTLYVVCKWLSCVHVYTCVYMHTCMYLPWVCVHAFMHVYTLCIYMCLKCGMYYIYIYIYIYILYRACRSYTYIRISIYIYIYTHTNTHTYIHTYIHTRTR